MNGGNMKKLLFITLILLTYTLTVNSQTIWLDKLDLSNMESGWGTAQANKSVEGNILSIAGKKFERGVGTSCG